MLMPGIAAADTKSTQGDDFSIDQNARAKVMTCDQESDGDKVHADVRYTTDPDHVMKFVTDGDGANGRCASQSISLTINGPRIAQHRTVEERPLGDIYGNWVSTS